MRTVAVIMALIILALPGKELLAENRLVIPDGVYYYRFASSVQGPEAVWINPAGLEGDESIIVQGIAELSDHRLAKNWGLVFTGDGTGMSYRYLDRFQGEAYEEYIFAAGAKLGLGVDWGVSYRYVKRGAGIYNKHHCWNVGLLMTHSRDYTLGIVFSNLNRSRVDGRHTDIEQLYSITYGVSGSPLQFSAACQLSTGQSLESADYCYGFEIIPIKGAIIHFHWESKGDWELGLRCNLLNYFIGNQSRVNNEGYHQRSSLFAGYVSGDQPSLIPPKPKAAEW